MLLYRMKTSPRLGLGFGVVIVLRLLMAVAGIGRLADVSRQTERMADQQLPKLVLSGKPESVRNEAPRRVRHVRILAQAARIRGEIGKVVADPGRLAW